MNTSRPRLALAASLIALGLAAGGLAAPAQAFHIPGATYNGSVSGGGTVQFTVSPDGAMVTNFRIENVQGSTCTFILAQDPSGTAITNHAFSKSGSFTYNGSFQAVRSAAGTISVTSNFPSPCSTGTQSWTATTTASPAGTEECLNAQAAVADAQKAVKKAKKKVRKAETQEEKRKAKKKLKKAKEELKAAEAQQAANCG